MGKIIIKEYETFRETEVLSLYKSVGWSAYCSQPQVLRRAFENSLCTLAAWEEDRLAGLIRCVGDGQTIVFIQDILVDPAFRRRGIGTMLIGTIRERYTHVRQMHLLTDDLPETVGFYKATGFTPAEKVRCRAFTRLRY